MEEMPTSDQNSLSRRLAAIMFTDIVGYTKLMQSSESKALQIRSRYREIIESITAKYEGQIVNYFGDGSVSFFSSTVQAVKCSVELQSEFSKDPRVPLRIGLHTGDIIITDSDIIGDSVNIASRIESMGVPGSILVSGKVAKEIANQDGLPIKKIGKYHFKNVSEAMEIFAMDLPGLAVPHGDQVSGKLEDSGATGKKSKFKFSRLSISLFVLLFSVVLISGWYFDRQSKIRMATYDMLPTVQDLIKTFKFSEAYQLAKEAKKYIPDNPILKDLISQSISTFDITSEPEGAKVYAKPYKNHESAWEYLGITPLSDISMAKGIYRWMFEKEGFDTVYAVQTNNQFNEQFNESTDVELFEANHLYRKLDEKGKIPLGMVRVNGKNSNTDVPDFYIDRYEVTNSQFKNFINQGAYEDPRFWKFDIIKDGELLNWSEAMSLFVDQTGQNGPSAWVAGDYPDGQDDHPVEGISWYEAAAYAEYANKSLPTRLHWWLARRDIDLDQVAPLSNYNLKNTLEVGSLPGITGFGVYDMAGNVREWCWNETNLGRLTRGGGYNNNTYSFGNLQQAQPFDRSPANGFRCVVYLDRDSIPETVFDPVSAEPRVNYPLEPVSDEIFEVYRENFIYDKTNLNSEILYTNDEHQDWVEQKVVFDAAYGNEKVYGYLFLPKSSAPPYHAVVYWPGSGSVAKRSSKDITTYYEFPAFLEFIIKTGRAVFYPVYKGTFERGSESLSEIHIGWDASREFSEFMEMIVKDFQRSIDYLETRDDIDTRQLAFCGMSWGAVFGPLAGAIDHRIKTNIYIVGGLDFKTRPEVLPLNFLPRVKAPTLMISGRYDSRLPLESSAMPMYELIGSSGDDKKHVILDSGHYLPSNDMIKEILSWLDKQLGQVNRLAM